MHTFVLPTRIFKSNKFREMATLFHDFLSLVWCYRCRLKHILKQKKVFGGEPTDQAHNGPVPSMHCFGAAIDCELNTSQQSMPCCRVFKRCLRERINLTLEELEGDQGDI